MNQSNTALRWAALAALALTTTAAQAALFDLNYAGTFDNRSLLGGTALANGTPFSITATFDPSLNTGPSFFATTGFFEVTALSLTLNGSTYTAITSSSLNVIFDGSFVGLSDAVFGSGGSASTRFLGTAEGSFNQRAPSLASFFGAGNSQGNYTLPLSGVSGGLSIYGEGISSATASITATAVPEPAEYAAVTGLALGVFALVQRRRKAAGR